MAQEEIDLVNIAAKGIDLFMRNIKGIVFAMLLGIALGYGFYLLKPKVYENSMTINSKVLTFSISKVITDDLNRLIREQNFQQLGLKLNITPEEAGKIQSITIKTPIERAELLKEDEKVMLTVSVECSDQSLFPKIQESLIVYFQNNNYSKVRIEEKTKYFNTLIEKSNSELSELEKLRANFLDGKLFTKTSGTIMFDPTTINTAILLITKEKLGYEYELSIVGGIQVIEGFTNFSKPVSPKLSISLSVGAIIGLIFIGALIVFKSAKKLSQLSAEGVKN